MTPVILRDLRRLWGRSSPDTSASEAALRRAEADDAEVASLVRRLRQHRQRNHFAQRVDRLYRETPGRSA